MKTLTKALLFGAGVLTISGAASAADQKPSTHWVQPPAWVMLLGRGDQVTTISPDRAVYIAEAINPTAPNLAEAR